MAFSDNIDNYKVWVFAPYAETTDANLQYYNDYTQSIAEYTDVFAELNCEWEWLDVTLQNLTQQIEKVKAFTQKNNIVLNLCDGDEINGQPGISVIHALAAAKLIYTGADAYFYDITTSKITMKEVFEQYGVPMPKWVKLTHDTDTKALFDTVGKTVIVKPAVSAGSMGLTIKNVVTNNNELEALLVDIKKGYRGWKLDEAGLIAEEFIIGREFTTFLVGSYRSPNEIKFYQPAERVFHASLSEKEQFLSFDRLWEFYEDETPMPNDDYFYEYADVPAELTERLKEISLKACHAVKATGYARLDIRMAKGGQLYVLEINAQCGISDDENFTSIGAILRFSNKTFTNLVVEIIEEALKGH